MIYPLTIKKTIVVNQNASDIPSEDTILSHIDEHMEQFNMSKYKYPNNEMYYYKLPFVRVFRRKDLIENISIKVSCIDQEIITVLRTNTTRILIPLVLLIVGIPLVVGNPFIYSIKDKPFLWFIITVVLLQSIFLFVLRNITLNRFYDEIKLIIQNLNE